VWVRVHFYTHGLNQNPNPARIEPGSGAGFVFHLRVHPNPKKTKTRKKPDRNLKPLERNSFTKPDGLPKPDRFECQISPVGAGSGVKFNPTKFFRGSGIRSTQPKSDTLPSLASHDCNRDQLNAVLLTIQRPLGLGLYGDDGGMPGILSLR
jgi:hypothetical protein